MIQSMVDQDDIINGERGVDKIQGGEGNDRLYGGRAEDELDGEEGNDEIDGGKGIDILSGGIGADTFICDLTDTIIDFNSAEGDKKIGQCSVIDKALEEKEEEIETTDD